MIKINLLPKSKKRIPRVIFYPAALGLFFALVGTYSLINNLILASHAPKSTRSIASQKKSERKSGKNWLLSGKDSDVQKFIQATGVKADSIFSSKERQYLISKGQKDLAQVRKLSLPGTEAATRLRTWIRNERLNVSLQPDFLLKTKRMKSATRFVPKTDPLSPQQWALKNTGELHREFIDNFSSRYVQGVVGEDVHLPAQSKEGAGIVVAILDTGMDLTHPDLMNQVYRKPGECAALEAYAACVQKDGKAKCQTQAAVDTDGNGYPMDCTGWNMTSDEEWVLGPDSTVLGDQVMEDPADIAHGSHVAGIIAAEAGNTVGIRGIAPRAKILPVRVIDAYIDSSGGGSVAQEDDATTLISTVVRGMVYAVTSKANVINISLGWDRFAESLVSAPPPKNPDGSDNTSAPEKSLMETAVGFARSQGVLVVSSAGNDSTDALVYPCQNSGILCVAAHEADGNIAPFSNYGSGVDIAAPGHDILSTMPFDYDAEVFTDQKGYDFLDGTSMASPYVAGAAAVLMSEGFNADETFARLVAGARRRPLVGQKLVLSGNLDVENALNVAPRPLFGPAVKGVTYGIWDVHTSRIHLKFKLKNFWAAAKNVQVKIQSADSPVLSRFYSLVQTNLGASDWGMNEEKQFEFDLDVLDRRMSSDVTVMATVSTSGGIPQNIRIPFIISNRFSASGEHPNTVKLPILSGSVLQNATMYSIVSQDGARGSDFVAVLPGVKEWKIQLVLEKNGGYAVSQPRTIPAMKNGGIRFRQRLDVTLDGKSEYVLAFSKDGVPPKPEPGKAMRAPVYYDFYYLDENGQDVLPTYTYKNEVTDMDLDHLQWLKVGTRLVQAWVHVGTTPEVEKPEYDPFNPKPKDRPDTRIYYHDPSTPDGLRSINAPKNYYLETQFKQSLQDRVAGQFSVLMYDSFKYMTDYFVATVSSGAVLSKPARIPILDYRNLRSLELLNLVELQGGDHETLAAAGVSGVNDQLVSALINTPNGMAMINQDIIPDRQDMAYKVMGAFYDSSLGNSGGLATFSQANYSFLYKDSSLATPLETSLRRYTFLSTALFQRLFSPAVAESNGVRLPALFIGDGFGAYLGAELIVPVQDSNGKTLALTRPAYLRFLNTDCDWLDPRKASAAGPSEAVYFCGDHFLKIPYRF